jgi:hypothetical protein
VEYYRYLPLVVREPPKFYLGCEYIERYHKFAIVIPDYRKFMDWRNLLTETGKIIKIPLSNKYKAKRQRRLDYYSRSRRVKRRKELLKRGK